MRTAITQDLFSTSATSLEAITREWKQRQRSKVQDATVQNAVFEIVEVIAANVQAEVFDEGALPIIADEAGRQLVSSYLGQATCGLLSLRVRYALDACLSRPTTGLPDLDVLKELVRRLRSSSSRYERPKDSSRI